MKKLTIILYCIFLLIFSVFSYVFIDPNLYYLKDFYTGFVFSNRFLTAIFYIFSVIIFFVFYGIFIWLTIKKRLKINEILLLVGANTGVLFFSYPAMLSFDVFNYIATSKILFFYHENPYIVMPIEFAGDPLLDFTHAANKIALYGPVWILLTGIPYFVGFGSFLANLFAIKFFVAMFYLATTFLIWKISKNLISLILFAFNPLIIIETLVSSHNDVVMMFLMLLSFYVCIKKKIFFAIFLFTFSILIKYATLLLLPIFLYTLWKNIKKEEIDWNNIFYYSSLVMLLGFFLSPIREEIYPWYAIWFLPFSFLVSNKRVLLYLSLAFSFGLLFRYVPFMVSGTHAGMTPLIKQIVTFTPPILVSFYIILRKKLWQRYFR